MNQYKIKSKIGPLFLTFKKNRLSGLYFKENNSLKISRASNLNDNEFSIYNNVIKQINEYLSGEREKFDIPLFLEGTIFQKNVWNELCKIPFGQSRSYKNIAIKIKNEKAYRAVGTSNGKNPIAIIIPCHRVINANGGLGGYSSGLKIKKKLLKIENIPFRN